MGNQCLTINEATNPKKSLAMANKKEIFALGAAAAAVLGGYFLKESFKEGSAEGNQDQKKDAKEITEAVDYVKFGVTDMDKEKTEEKKDKDTESLVDKLKDTVVGSKDNDEEEKNNCKNTADVPPAK